MLVKDIMTTAVKTASATDSVRDIATIMCFNKINASTGTWSICGSLIS
ncbi:MAG: hypothetical protein H6R46_731 [Proteobacteria bacterium]|nr:hypothetical protein [Pseudomonadota bacterium]